VTLKYGLEVTKGDWYYSNFGFPLGLVVILVIN